MRKIEYRTNPNNKLSNKMYCAMLPASLNYKQGERVAVYVGAEKKHEAVIVKSRVFDFSHVNDFVTCLDAGVMHEVWQKYFLERYPSFDAISDQVVMLILKPEAKPQNEKIALFCEFYERYNGVKYKISRAEIGMIKHVPVNEDLLEKFFKCTEFWAKVKSVTYYCKNINEIRSLNVKKAQKSHPNEWSDTYAAKLDGEGLTEYYRHLRSLGLKAVKNGVGKIIDWKHDA